MVSAERHIVGTERIGRRSPSEDAGDSLEDQLVSIGGSGEVVGIREGEAILTEISRKYTREDVDTMLREEGFELIDWVTDDDERFALSLAKPV